VPVVTLSLALDAHDLERHDAILHEGGCRCPDSLPGSDFREAV
jgi:hypothetical protein